MSNFYYGTKDDNILSKYSIPKENYYVKEEFKPDSYDSLFIKLKNGDILYLSSFDTLGSNINTVIDRWKSLLNEKQIDIVLCDYPAIDTRNYTELKNASLSNLVLYMLNYIKKRERCQKKAQDIERERGIIAAKKAGVKFGRKISLTKEDFITQYYELKQQGFSTNEICSHMDISKSTYFRYKKNWID